MSSRFSARFVVVRRRLHALGCLLLGAAVFALSVAPCRGENPKYRHQAPQPLATDSPFFHAAVLLSQGRTAEAAVETERQLTNNPSSVEGYNLLGIIESRQDNYSDALQAFQQALKLHPNSVETHNNLAGMYAAEGKPDLAEKELRKVLALAPSDNNANYNLGLLLMTEGSPAAALPYLRRVHPQDVETSLTLVRACLRAGRVADALKISSQISAAHKSDAQLHLALGVLLAEEKQYKPGQLELEKADALAPNTFQILYDLGQSYLQTGNYSQSAESLDRALKLEPQSSQALYLLARVYFEEQRPLDALDLLTRAHKLSPQNTDIIFLMARISMTQNYFEDAIPLLQSGLKISPDRPDLHAALGESYFMSGNEEKSVDEFKQLVALDPSARSYAFLGLAYRHLGRFNEARDAFQSGLKKDPHNASCLFNLGFIDERQGNAVEAEKLFRQALQTNPDFSEALLELANLDSNQKKFAEAAELLRKYIKVGRDTASGYYKLAMVERSMHQMSAAERDLKVFQTLSRNAPTGPYPYQHLFDYLDNRSKLNAGQRTQLDITQLTEDIKKHPGQPQDFYLLAEAYLKAHQQEEALDAIAQLDKISADDYRTQAGVGVLLARYHLYDQAVQHFQAALTANPGSDDVKFDLADAYLQQGHYPNALTAMESLSAAGQQDDSCLALLGDIYAHLGDAAKSTGIFKEAIRRNPDNDQYYLSLALVELREGQVAEANDTLQQGEVRIPSSGKIIWGLGLISVLQGNLDQAAERLERAVDLLPEWAGSYSTLGVFYYSTGQIAKAREVLDRFKDSDAGGLDISRIEQALSRAPENTSPRLQPMTADTRRQFLGFALAIADRTL